MFSQITFTELTSQDGGDAEAMLLLLQAEDWDNNNRSALYSKCKLSIQLIYSLQKWQFFLPKTNYTQIKDITVILLEINIQITFEMSTAKLANCLKILRDKILMSKKNQPKFCIHRFRCQHDFGAWGRLQYSCSASHKISKQKRVKL